ncbi:MAG: branched-chain amino acid ABC transporter substrate-binding protein [Anaerolineales bacterium]|nr:branched-chain amino acid ABC transporter substrate-binding protein [Anaerolineae bacterium]PWB51179.1 MAG: branched-chain amino acid ABC transporter substrate-binding protein [Anaerolineales bacterium]
MSKRIFGIVSLLMILSMLLAACGGQAYTCTDSIGCVTVAPSEPVHLAYALAISGSDATLGTDSRNGAEVAIQDVGGKLLDHDIKFDGADEGCSAEGGQSAGTKLAADPSIVAILGTSCSSAVRVAIPLWSKAGFTVISPSNTAVDLTLKGNENNWPGYLRTAHSDSVQGKAAAEFAYNFLKVTKAATIHDGSIYAQQLQQVFADNFTKLGGTITAQESVDPQQTDMSGVLTSIAAGSPELIYHPIFVQAGTQIIRQARTTPGLENVYLMGADGMFSTDVMKGAGDAVEGVFASSPDTSAYGPDYAAKFLPEYQAKFGTVPISIFHAHAYDAMNMIFACVNKVTVKDSDGTLHIPRQGLRDCMYATKDFKGLTGNLTCTPTGDCADPKIAVYEYHTGQYPPEKIWP